LGSCRAFGRVRPDEGLVQLLSAAESIGFDDLGRLGVAPIDSANASTIAFLQPRLFFEPSVSLPALDAIEIVDVEAGLDSRRLAVARSLADKSVLLVGAGSVGSLAGLLLAEAGIGRFLVVDNDRLDAANLSRHACGIEDLGRRKARAVAELLARRAVSAEPHDQDLLELADGELDALVGSVDLVVATTDSPAAQFLANESCVRTGRLGLFAGAYERAAGGEVIAYRPGSGPCLYCAVGFRAEAAPGLVPQERRQAYQDSEQNRLIAEPGLGVDTALLSGVTAAVALSLLDPEGSRADLISPGSFLLLHGGSTPREALAELFHRPFEFLTARVTRTEPCPVCGYHS